MNDDELISLFLLGYAQSTPEQKRRLRILLCRQIHRQDQLSAEKHRVERICFTAAFVIVTVIATAVSVVFLVGNR